MWNMDIQQLRIIFCLKYSKFQQHYSELPWGFSVKWLSLLDHNAKNFKKIMLCWRWIFSGWLCIRMHESGMGVCVCVCVCVCVSVCVCACVTNVDVCTCTYACMAHVCACTCVLSVHVFDGVLLTKKKNWRMILTIFSFPDTHASFIRM